MYGIPWIFCMMTISSVHYVQFRKELLTVTRQENKNIILLYCSGKTHARRTKKIGDVLKYPSLYLFFCIIQDVRYTSYADVIL